MKVKFIKSGVYVGYGHFEGDETDLPKAKAQKLLKGGYVVAMGAKPVNRTAKKTTDKKEE